LLKTVGLVLIGYIVCLAEFICGGIHISAEGNKSRAAKAWLLRDFLKRQTRMQLRHWQPVWVYDPNGPFASN
jgi:hypothetical protein